MIVSAKDLPATLQQVLQKITEKRFSVRELKQALEKNRCLVNQVVERFGSRKLYAGDAIDLMDFTKEEMRTPSFIFEEARVLFENEESLVYNKPAGLASMDNGLFEILKKEKGNLFAVHRLDKDTSGVIVFAKTKKAEEAWASNFKKRAVLKQYLAIVQGRLSKKSGTHTSYLGKVGEFQGQSIIGSVGKAKGQFAETEWQVIKEQKNASLLRLTPKTGRTHQLRTHMSSLGHPLIGDVQYGWKRGEFYPKSFFLHAEVFESIDQKTNKRIRFTANIPPEFDSAIKSLFGGV